ncbi:hypothetical protein [Streptomyces aidingensis]|uniref:Uncharacterized protein n=1 Tax=Streptomyces aidingensis TaxID=910347 RepID=A0A1I1TSU3_9ACTN|nr:hypothetical protein [Streptomyces aidingensis]SFD61594.1 hypothetical protein SAMN05421773_12112 [Streptomyces aidingensis]
MTSQSAAPALGDIFDLDPQTTDLTTLYPGLADSEPCTGDNCGQSPTTGPTTGCVAPDGPVVPLRGCDAV